MVIAFIFQGGNPNVCLIKVLQTTVTSDNSLAPSLSYVSFRLRKKIDGHCLKQDKIIFNDEAVVNIFIVYEINLWPFKQSTDFTFGNFLFGAIKLTNNADFDKYKYSGYGIDLSTPKFFVI